MGFMDDLKKAGKEIKRSLMDIKTAPFVQEMCRTTANMYRLGWDERNGGNISYMLDEKEVAEYLDLNNVIRVIPLMGVEEGKFDCSALAGKIFIVTGTGKYFKNVQEDPEVMGLQRRRKNYVRTSRTSYVSYGKA